MNKKVLVNNSEKGFFRVISGVGVGINPKGQEGDKLIVDINDQQVQSLLATGCFSIEELSDSDKVETTLPQSDLYKLEQIRLTAKALEDRQNKENQEKLDALKQTATMMEQTAMEKREFVNKLAKDTAEQMEKQQTQNVESVKDSEKPETKEVKKVKPMFGNK